MKNRPWPLAIYSIAVLVIACSLPFQVAAQYEIPIGAIYKTFRYLTLLNVTMMATLLAASYSAQVVSRSLFILAPLAAITVALNNLWVGYVEINVSGLEAWLGTFLFMGLSCVLLERKTVAVMMNRKAQWWKTPPRKVVEKPIVLLPWNGDSFVGTTFDLSENGVFVCSRHIDALNVGDSMQLRMKVDGHRDVRCTARLVRKSDGENKYPSGFGIRFEDISRNDRRLLRQMVSVSTH